MIVRVSKFGALAASFLRGGKHPVAPATTPDDAKTTGLPAGK